MTTRYVVQWNSWADLQAAAKRHGMPEGGEPFNYADTGDFEKERVFKSFKTAVSFARSVIPFDTWSAPRVRRQQLVPHDTDDRGREVEPSPDWETNATWEASKEDAMNEAEPDWTEPA